MMRKEEKDLLAVLGRGEEPYENAATKEGLARGKWNSGSGDRRGSRI